MSDFKEFVKSTHQNELSNSSSLELTTRISGILAATVPSIFSGSSISNADREKFSEEVVKAANSDEVLTELSQEIGEPKETESEDEFVESAKTTFAKILKRKLMK